MPVHLIIDGYNLIRQSRHLSDIDAGDIMEGRLALLRLLAAYRKMKHHPITVVFDGMAALRGAPERDTVSGITVVFSRQGESADQVIKRMAAAMGPKAMVVTSDRDIISTAEHYGCGTIPAPAFEAKLQMAALLGTDGDGPEETTGGWKPTTRKKGPDRRLPKKQRRLQRLHQKL